VVGNDSVVLGATGGRGVVVAVTKLQAMDTDMIAHNNSILCVFIFPPEEYRIHFISFHSNRKPLVRVERGVS
jgi:hypothetical protein